mmetsp:Transcript_14925/g.42303  ORF Transcript_14925/g.42303 Transcript_14925/m.42303 type:complete len:322 (+) Transcript_14925:38-1003(+)
MGAAGCLFSSIAGELPSTGVRSVIAYGSGVFDQGVAADPGRLLDFLLVVDDAVAWHRDALCTRPQDYSGFSRAVGPSRVAALQRWGGGKAWFHAGVQVALPGTGEMAGVKYGVICTDDLIEDLETWSTLYISGRLHKPVRFVRAPGTAALKSALHTNLQHAVHTALFLLPEQFTEKELFTKIAALSYSGDVRMALAEDPRKVENIVRGSLPHFQALYEPWLGRQDTRPPVGFAGSVTRASPSSDLLFQDSSPEARQALWQSLPVHGTPAAGSDLRVSVAAALAGVVSRSSRVQSAKGLLSAGPLTALRYGLRKVAKRTGVL